MSTKKKYTLEFKEEAVKLVTEQGYSQSEAAKSLGVKNNNISRWVAQLPVKKEMPLKVKSTEQAELEMLRKENKRLKLEREILKKAAAFFANESS